MSAAEIKQVSLEDDNAFVPIPGFSDYRINRYGIVESIKSGEWKRLKQEETPSGRLRYSLHRNGKKTTKFVHCLVLETFVGPCPQGLQCRHLDGDCKNNHISNLCWGTPKENAADRDRHGTTVRGTRVVGAKLNEFAVKVIQVAYGKVTQFELAKAFGVSQTTIHDVISNKTWRGGNQHEKNYA